MDIDIVTIKSHKLEVTASSPQTLLSSAARASLSTDVRGKHPEMVNDEKVSAETLTHRCSSHSLTSFGRLHFFGAVAPKFHETLSRLMELSWKSDETFSTGEFSFVMNLRKQFQLKFN